MSVFQFRIDAVADDEKLTFEFVKSKLLQKKQKITERSKSFNKSASLALIGKMTVELKLGRFFSSLLSLQTKMQFRAKWLP